jgi:dephospho-CoA kinase
VIVGLTGPNAAGKGEIGAWLAARGYALHSLSDVVREAARAAGQGVSREVLIETGQALRREHGPGVLAERILPRLGARSAVDSIRSPAEVEVLRRLPAFRLLGVDAPVEVRWQRAVDRGREGDVPDLRTFVEREQRENTDSPDSQQLRRALALADTVVRNDATLARLLERVEAVVTAWEAELDGPPGR